MGVLLHSFLSSAPGGLSGQLYVPAALLSAKPLGYLLSRRLGESKSESKSESGLFEKRYQPPTARNEIFGYLLTHSLALRLSESLCLLNYRIPFFSAHRLLSPSFNLHLPQIILNIFEPSQSMSSNSSSFLRFTPKYFLKFPYMIHYY